MRRRQFLQRTAAAAAGGVLARESRGGEVATMEEVGGGAAEPLRLPKRAYGESGIELSTIGFSAHSAEVALDAMRRFRFDSILFPINFATYHKAGFGPPVIREAVDRGVARLALKALAKQTWAEGRIDRGTGSAGTSR